MHSIEKRLERLEGQNRRLRVLLAGVSLLAVLPVLVGQASAPQPREIQAKRIAVVDADGAERIVMENGAIVFLDAAGVRGASLDSKVLTISRQQDGETVEAQYRAGATVLKRLGAETVLVPGGLIMTDPKGRTALNLQGPNADRPRIQVVEGGEEVWRRP